MEITNYLCLPQTIKTIKEKNTKGMSLHMYSMFTAGVFLWLLYGLFTKDIPVLLANLVTFSFALTILILKLKYRWAICMSKSGVIGPCRAH